MDSTGKRAVRRTLKAEIGVYQCPRECGWRREFHRDPIWQQDYIDHPVYGIVKQIEAVNADIARHSCYTHVLAAERLRKIIKRYNER